jgi:hypothetical protein
MPLIYHTDNLLAQICCFTFDLPVPDADASTMIQHLYRAFPKLGITSRGRLREVLDASQP